MKHRDSESIFSILSDLATRLGAEFRQEGDSAHLAMENSQGRGELWAYSLIPGLESVVCDITLLKPREFQFKFADSRSLCFLFCKEGWLEHKFQKEAQFERLEFQQNVILKPRSVNNNTVRVAPHTPLKVSAILVSGEKLNRIANKDRSSLQHDLLDLYSTFPEEQPYRHLGRISPVTANYVQQLLGIHQNDVAGRLLKKSTILNILSSQILKHNSDVASEGDKCPIRKIELDKIIGLASFISDNISEPLHIPHLKRLSGLNARKLQDGFQFLYGVSVANYISGIRLKKALSLLDKTDLSISEVVYRVGLSSRSYFSKIFKETYGIRPVDYRASMRN